MVHPVVITLLRHGLTEANERKEYLGWTDSPLSKRGKDYLRNLQLECNGTLISSDLGRCLQTAKFLFPTIPVKKNVRFREMNWGKWEGKTYEELKENHDYQLWLNTPLEAPVPDGESYPAFSRRIELGWHEQVQMEDGNFTLITHGGVIRELLVRYAPESRSFWGWQIPYAGGYQLFWECRDALRRGDRCTSLQVVPIMERPNG